MLCGSWRIAFASGSFKVTLCLRKRVASIFLTGLSPKQNLKIQFQRKQFLIIDTKLALLFFGDRDAEIFAWNTRGCPVQLDVWRT